MQLNKVTALTAVNIKTDPVTIRAKNGANSFNLDISGTWAGTITVLRKIDKINAIQSNNLGHTGADGAAALTAGGMQGVAADELIGMWVRNDTDGTTAALKSMGPITDNTTSVITATLAGGTDDDFDAGDQCSLWGVVDTYTANTATVGTEGAAVAEYLAIMSIYTSGTARVQFSQ
jgi:hypothetical protein